MTVFVKQFGKERTGTNWLRAMIEANFPAAGVLMHILGDKHQAPTKAVRDQTFGGLSDPVEVVWSATMERPAKTTNPKALDQRDFVASIAADLYGAVQGGRLKSVISVRQPHDWSISRCNMLGLIGGAGSALERHGESFVIDALKRECKAYDTANKTWIEFAGTAPHRVRIIPLEELSLEPEKTIGQLADFLECHRSSWSRVANTALPTHWDNFETRLHFDAYDVRPPKLQLHPQKALNRIIDTVNKYIDWSLYERFGYGPR